MAVGQGRFTFARHPDGSIQADDRVGPRYDATGGIEAVMVDDLKAQGKGELDLEKIQKYASDAYNQHFSNINPAVQASGSLDENDSAWVSFLSRTGVFDDATAAAARMKKKMQLIKNMTPTGLATTSDQEASTKTTRNTSTEDELRPFLPTMGSALLERTSDERQLAGLNLAIYDNKPRDLGVGDARINPLMMDVAMEEGRRFNGDNKILDTVFNGGSLNLGALPGTTERLMLPLSELTMYHSCAMAKRAVRLRTTARDDYEAMKVEAAAFALQQQKTDVRWVYAGNQGASDVFHTSAFTNTMPIETDEWMSHRQIDGDVPLQPNILPAQGLSITAQLGGGPPPTSQFNSLAAKQDPAYNPPTRFGWNYATSFQ
jgi:hypothetical protein